VVGFVEASQRVAACRIADLAGPADGSEESVPLDSWKNDAAELDTRSVPEAVVEELLRQAEMRQQANGRYLVLGLLFAAGGPIIAILLSLAHR
jgi:hypothetical protein